MKIAVFAYHVPHKKTQDFLFRLFLEKIDVAVVLAANYVDLKISSPTVRVKPRYGVLTHPKILCERFGWRFEVIDHCSAECAKLLHELEIDLGIIAGARILGEPIIRATEIGIVNFHPGFIPEARGLDALQWSIYENLPIGVTAHLIDKHVDAGRIILRQEIELWEDDTLIDLSLRLHEKQVEMLPVVIDLLKRNRPETFEKVGEGRLHGKMPPDLEEQIPERLKERLKKLQKAMSTSAENKHLGA